MFERAPAPTLENQPTRPAGGWPFTDSRTISAAVIFLAVLIRLLVPIDANIDWLMSNCRVFLNGGRLYQDIVETNPPMAIFIYLPGALIERFTGLPAEAVFTALLLAAGTGSAWLFCRCARAIGVSNRYLFPLTLFVLLVAPLSAFGEREHVALVLVMPLLGVVMRRMARQSVPVRWWLLAGLAAGMIAMIKPHFALPVLAVYAGLAAYRRDVRLLFCPEAVLTALMLVIYVALVWQFLPAYPKSVLPMLFQLYRPLRRPVTDIALSYKILIWLISIGCLIFSVRKTVLTPLPFTLLLASTGFMLGFIDQGRGWPYHALPFVALTLLAIAATIPPALNSGVPMRRVPAIAALIAALMHLGYFTGFNHTYMAVVKPIRAAVAHPTVMSISFDLTPGHPITTEAHGAWVGTYSSRWITVNASYLLIHTSDPTKRAALKNWMRFDRRVTNHDLMKRPDIVLVGIGPFNWPGWIASDPQTKALMADYVPLAGDRLSPADRERLEGIAAYIRKDLIRAPPATP